MKTVTIKKALGAQRAIDLKMVIELGNDLVSSIEKANWSYNLERGLPHPTLHMKLAVKNWKEAEFK